MNDACPFKKINPKEHKGVWVPRTLLELFVHSYILKPALTKESGISIENAQTH